MLLEVKNVSLSFGGIVALSDVTFGVEEHTVHALIGPNGSGKTSTFNVISGIYSPQKGEILFRGRNMTHTKPYSRANMGVARTFQNIELFRHMTVLDNLMLGRHTRLTSGLFSSLIWLGKTVKEEVAHRERVEAVIDLLEIERWRHQSVDTIPYGVQKRVELGRALAMDPKILLLDEPCAGMNVEETEDIVRFILDIREEWKKTILLVEHDMGVVMDISDRVTVMEFGIKIAEGSPDQVQQNADVVNAYLGEETP